MKRFLLFSGAEYYPCGGCNDFHSSHETFLSAMEVVQTLGFEWWHVLDIQTGLVSREGEDCSPLEERG